MVATATSNLCDAANLVVKGNADEDKLIAAAKAVAAHTAQLLHAAQVKADPHSENNKRLQVTVITYIHAHQTWHQIHVHTCILEHVLVVQSLLKSPE